MNLNDYNLYDCKGEYFKNDQELPPDGAELVDIGMDWRMFLVKVSVWLAFCACRFMAYLVTGFGPVWIIVCLLSALNLWQVDVNMAIMGKAFMLWVQIFFLIAGVIAIAMVVWHRLEFELNAIRGQCRRWAAIPIEDESGYTCDELMKVLESLADIGYDTSSNRINELKSMGLAEPDKKDRGNLFAQPTELGKLALEPCENECHIARPYGWVPEADCPIHDVPIARDDAQTKTPAP